MLKLLQLHQGRAKLWLHQQGCNGDRTANATQDSRRYALWRRSRRSTRRTGRKGQYEALGSQNHQHRSRLVQNRASHPGERHASQHTRRDCRGEGLTDYDSRIIPDPLHQIDPQRTANHSPVRCSFLDWCDPRIEGVWPATKWRQALAIGVNLWGGGGHVAHSATKSRRVVVLGGVAPSWLVASRIE